MPKIELTNSSTYNSKGVEIDQFKKEVADHVNL